MIVGLLGAAGGLLLQEETGEEVLVVRGRKKNMQGKIMSHAPVAPKPPKARTYNTSILAAPVTAEERV